MKRLVKTETSFKRARYLRAEMTEPERLLWMLLRHRRFAGHKFRRHVPLGSFIADFVCFEQKLIVELDGGQHGDPDAIAYDARRTAALEAAGFRVLRFWNGQLYTERQDVLDTIWLALRRSG